MPSKKKLSSTSSTPIVFRQSCQYESNIKLEQPESQREFWNDHKKLQHFNCKTPVSEINNHEASHACSSYITMSSGTHSPCSLCYSGRGVHLYCNMLQAESCIPLDLSDSRVLNGPPRVRVDIVEGAESFGISTAHITNPTRRQYGLFFMTLVELAHLTGNGDVRPNAEIIQFRDTTTKQLCHCLYLLRTVRRAFIVVGQRYCLDTLCPMPNPGQPCPYGEFRFFVCHSLVADIEDNDRVILEAELLYRETTCLKDAVPRAIGDCYPPCDDDDCGYSKNYIAGRQKYNTWVRDHHESEAPPADCIPPGGLESNTRPYWRITTDGGILYYPPGASSSVNDFSAGEIARLGYQYLSNGSKPTEVAKPLPLHCWQIELPLPPLYHAGEYPAPYPKPF